MAALLTYRSRDSFESRFGRRAGGPKNNVPKGGIRIMGGKETTDPNQPGEADKDWENNEASKEGERAWHEHNDGHRGGKSVEGPNKVFSAQSYLRYQGDKVSLYKRPR
jgi:homoserine O-acetyltransferase